MLHLDPKIVFSNIKTHVFHPQKQGRGGCNWTKVETGKHVLLGEFSSTLMDKMQVDRFPGYFVQLVQMFENSISFCVHVRQSHQCLLVTASKHLANTNRPAHPLKLDKTGFKPIPQTIPCRLGNFHLVWKESLKDFVGKINVGVMISSHCVANEGRKFSQL